LNLEEDELELTGEGLYELLATKPYGSVEEEEDEEEDEEKLPRLRLEKMRSAEAL
jgi:hypothetical protein